MIILKVTKLEDIFSQKNQRGGVRLTPQPFKGEMVKCVS